MSKKPKTTVLKTFLLPIELADWLKSYTDKTHLTMTKIIIDHLTELKKQTEDHVEQI